MLAPGKAGAGEKRQAAVGVAATWSDRLLQEEASLSGSGREVQRLRPDWTGLGWLTQPVLSRAVKDNIVPFIYSTISY